MARSPHSRTLPIEQASPGITEVTYKPRVGSRVRITDYTLTMSAAGTVRWETEDGDALSGPMECVAGGGFSVAGSDSGVIAAPEGKAIRINTSGGRANGHLTCVSEPI